MRTVGKVILAGVLTALLLALALTPKTSVHADTAGVVTVKGIDYETLIMKVYLKGNGILYSSLDRKTWNEVEGMYDEEGDFLYVDISWAAATSNVTVYFRGDVNRNETKLILPKQNSSFKPVFDKLSGDFDFTGVEGQQYFFYRKSTDYNWQKVYFEGFSGEDGISYAQFLEQIKLLRFKGASIIMKLGQNAGEKATEDDPGERPSKEVKVSITKLATAPNITLKVTNLTLNTRETMEYSFDTNTWRSCLKNMSVEEIAPSAYSNGHAAGADVLLFFRNSATEKKPESQIMTLTIPGQKLAPAVSTVAGSEIAYEYTGGKLKLTFNLASVNNAYEYCIIKDGTMETTTKKISWKAVKNTKSILLSSKQAPDGSIIYFRLKATAPNAKKGIALALPSLTDEIIVDFANNSSGTTPTGAAK